MNNSKSIMAHLVPIGTPFLLINFMVLIEVVSNVIRPLTLSVRLCANMVAGHLLLRLLRNFSLNGFNHILYSFLGLIILGVLEMAVALIQGYVFITLVSLYSTEIH
jgi:F-type H+-transporting ATPase subunit a